VRVRVRVRVRPRVHFRICMSSLAGLRLSIFVLFRFLTSFYNPCRWCCICPLGSHFCSLALSFSLARSLSLFPLSTTHAAVERRIRTLQRDASPFNSGLDLGRSSKHGSGLDLDQSQLVLNRLFL
jgi:hypothetical protein